MDFGFWRVAVQLGLDVSRGVNARRIEIAEVINVGRLVLSVDCFAALCRKLIEE